MFVKGEAIEGTDAEHDEKIVRVLQERQAAAASSSTDITAMQPKRDLVWLYQHIKRASYPQVVYYRFTSRGSRSYT